MTKIITVWPVNAQPFLHWFAGALWFAFRKFTNKVNIIFRKIFTILNDVHIILLLKSYKSVNFTLWAKVILG